MLNFLHELTCYSMLTNYAYGWLFVDGLFVRTQSFFMTYQRNVYYDYCDCICFIERIGTANTTESQKQMSIRLDVDDNVEIGSPFTVAAKVTNKLGDARLVSVSVVGRAELYTGAPGQRVTISQSDLELMGGGSKI